MVRTRTIKQGVHIRPIEMPPLRFHLLPVNRSFKRIDVQALECRPGLGQNFGPIAGIADLRSQHEVRRAINHQCVTAIPLDQFWTRRRCLRGRREQQSA